MARINSNLYVPTARVSETEAIEIAAVMQQRNGMDEPITLSGVMAHRPDIDPSAPWQPVSSSNPLEVRVRELEAELQQLRQLFQGGDAKVQLSGQKAAQTILPRAIRAAGTAEYRRIVTPPIDAKGCRLELSVFGVTGQFGSGEGINLWYREHTDALPANQVALYETRKTSGTGNLNQHLIMVYPGLSEANDGVLIRVNGVLGRRLVVQVNINGTFAAGEGFDCQLDVVWIM